MAKEIPGIDVDELEDCGIELHLQWNRVDVVAVREHDGDLEGATYGLGGDGRDHAKADGLARYGRRSGCR